MLRRSFIASLSVLALAAPAAAQAAPVVDLAPLPETAAAPVLIKGCADTNVVPTAATITKVRAATLCLVNAERKAAGRKAVRPQTHLRAAATKFAQRMVAQSFFAHVGPSGDTMTDRVKRTSYVKANQRWTLGENIAYGTGQLSTPESIVAGWMKSPGHKRNLLDPAFTDMGLGIALGAPTSATRGATYVTDYGSRG